MNFSFSIIFYTVPSENKKDIRSIEQTMADIQAKKRLKLTNEAPTTTTAAVAAIVESECDENGSKT